MAARLSLVGGLYALLAGAAFGVTMPFVHQFGAGVGTFGASALLYVGAAVACSIRTAHAPTVLPPRDKVRLLTVALFGAVLAPALLVWGLARTDGARASLALGVEMPFTVLLARLLFREPIGLRMGAAMVAMLASTTVLALPANLSGLAASAAGPASTIGLVAVIGAALAWATDSAVMRPLSVFDPRAIVTRKAIIGSVVSLLLAVAARESLPPLRTLVPLALLGALGYGVSLQMYLRAQRRIGAARAASLFAVGPLVGAVTGVVVGQTAIDLRLILATLACAFAVVLQLVEAGPATEGEVGEKLSERLQS